MCNNSRLSGRKYLHDPASPHGFRLTVSHFSSLCGLSPRCAKPGVLLPLRCLMLAFTVSSWSVSQVCGCGMTLAQGLGCWRTNRSPRRPRRAEWAAAAWRAPACCSARCASGPAIIDNHTPSSGHFKFRRWPTINSWVDWTDLHVQDFLESLRIAVRQEPDEGVNKHHRRVMWGHHHLQTCRASVSNSVPQTNCICPAWRYKLLIELANSSHSAHGARPFYKSQNALLVLQDVNQDRTWIKRCYEKLIGSY